VFDKMFSPKNNGEKIGENLPKIAQKLPKNCPKIAPKLPQN
jgi:hypothetical protein